MVSKASEDLPEPERPVNTTSRSRGISRSISLRLCSRAPRTAMTRGSRASLAGRFLSKRSFIGKWLPFPRPSAAGFEREFSLNVVRTLGFCQGGAGGYSRNTWAPFPGRRAARSGALLTRDRYERRGWNDPGSAVHRCRAAPRPGNEFRSANDKGRHLAG